ncbi:MAG: long-chain fatty acid--CoA ligase [Chloroflexaceae bacterium]|jgi:long-chain acyl-CoA synthetase|nr:long-chain fatty acid--CoA ligase [Chloroflexaceae bacterium]
MSNPSHPWFAAYDEGVPQSITVPHAPLTGLLAEAVRRFPNAPAVQFYGRTLSYYELSGEVLRFARGLVRAGLEPGERVLLLLPNVPQAVICYYGVLLAGGVVVLSNPLFDADTLLHHARDSGASTIVALSLFHELVAEARQHVPFQRVVYTNLKEYLPPVQRQLFTLLRQDREGHRVPANESERGLWLARLRKDGETEVALPTLDPAAPAVILYTSGTTGEAKGVVHSHRSLYANALQTSAWFTGAEPGNERVLCAIPFSHSYGMTAAMNFAVAIAASMILLPTFETQNVLHTIRRERPTIFPGVPPMYAALNEVRDVRKFGLSSLKGCISGAAPLPVEIQEGFERITRGRLVEGYGLSEAGPVTHANPIFGKRRAGTIGLPLPGTEARVVDVESGADLPPGAIGELLVRGPQVMQGYWQRPAETAEVLSADGWLHTGDLARTTSDGYFQIIERKKDVIVAGRFNIYPRDVEEVLYEHPKIVDAAVVGIPQADGSSEVKAFVVLREGERATEAEVFAFLRERLHIESMPTSVEFRQALPRSFIGKVLRRVLASESTKS